MQHAAGRGGAVQHGLGESDRSGLGAVGGGHDRSRVHDGTEAAHRWGRVERQGPVPCAEAAHERLPGGPLDIVGLCGQERVERFGERAGVAFASAALDRVAQRAPGDSDRPRASSLAEAVSCAQVAERVDVALLETMSRREWRVLYPIAHAAHSSA
jgi:hypothetical protein